MDVDLPNVMITKPYQQEPSDYLLYLCHSMQFTWGYWALETWLGRVENWMFNCILYWCRFKNWHSFPLLQNLSMFEITQVGESPFCCKIMNIKYISSISDENLTSKLRCALSAKYTPNFKNLIPLKYVKYLVSQLIFTFVYYWLRVEIIL